MQASSAQVQQPASGNQQSQQSALQHQLFMNHHLSMDSDELDLDEADYYDQMDEGDDDDLRHDH